MTTTNEHVTVTQADRDAAASMGTDAFWRDYTRSGRNDGTPLVQAFARHRIEATANVEPATQALLQEARGVIGEVFANRNVTKRLSWIDRAGGILTKLDAALGERP